MFFDLASFEPVVAELVELWNILGPIAITLVLVLSWVLILDQRKVVKALQKDVLKAKRDLDHFYQSYVSWLAEPELEAIIPGSGFEVEKPPNFQVRILTEYEPIVDGNLVVVGQGFVANVGRPNNKRLVLITARHVLDACSFSVVARGPLGEVYFKRSAFQTLGDNVDVAYAEVSTEVRSKLGVSEAKVAHLEYEVPVRVHGNGTTTTGLLSNAAQVGVVEYDGSTVKGFSGAPYYAGRSVYGIHTMGYSSKRKNFGVNLDFAVQLINRNPCRESSDEFFQAEICKQLQRGKFAWTYTHPTETDEVIFKDARGKHHVVEADLFDQWLDDEERRSSFIKGGFLGRPNASVVPAPGPKSVYVQTDSRITGTDYPHRVSLWVTPVKKGPELESSVEVEQPKPKPRARPPTVIDKIVQTAASKSCDSGVQTEPEEEPQLEAKQPSFLEKRLAPAWVSTNTEFPEPDVSLLRRLTGSLRELPSALKRSDTTGLVKTPAQQSDPSDSKWTELLEKQNRQIDDLRQEMKGYLAAIAQGGQVVVKPQPKKKSRYQKMRDQIAELTQQLAQQNGSKSG